MNIRIIHCEYCQLLRRIFEFYLSKISFRCTINPYIDMDYISIAMWSDKVEQTPTKVEFKNIFVVKVDEIHD